MNKLTPLLIGDATSQYAANLSATGPASLSARYVRYTRYCFTINTRTLVERRCFSPQTHLVLEVWLSNCWTTLQAERPSCSSSCGAVKIKYFPNGFIQYYRADVCHLRFASAHSPSRRHYVSITENSGRTATSRCL